MVKFTSQVELDCYGKSGMGVRCTAYYPQANEMVEFFFRQLNAALTSHSNPNQGTEFLPLVMLIIRTAVRTDSECPAAELVNGTTLGLPDEFDNPHTDSKNLDLENYIDQLWDRIIQTQTN